MRAQYITFTEPIFASLAGYRARLEEHPFLVAARAGEVPKPLLHEFAFHQLSDSILWVPMLALMRSKAHRSQRLQRALEENIGHETGAFCGRRDASHIALAIEMVRSLGLTAFEADLLTPTASLWMSDEFAAMSEPEIAGFLLGAETLVPLMFAAVLPAFQRIRGCDTRYLTEHVAVDGDEHAVWMTESVLEVIELYGPGAVPEVAKGMADAWDETREVPDELWRSRCASH